MENIRSEMYQNFEKIIINRTKQNKMNMIQFKQMKKWKNETKTNFVSLVDLLYGLYLVTLHKI